MPASVEFNSSLIQQPPSCCKKGILHKDKSCIEKTLATLRLRSQK